MKRNVMRTMSLAFAGIMAAGALTACGGNNTAATTAAPAEQTSAAGESAAEEATAASGEKKVLKVAMECAYAPYNWTQPDDSNGAVPINDSNEYAYGYDVMMAKKIADVVDGDLHEICPEIPYTSADLDWMNKKSRSSVEMSDKKYRPEIMKKEIDMSSYDEILLGFPIWWYVAPTIINTFLEAYDFSGKKIVLFATSGGSGFGNTVKELQPSAPEAVITEGSLLNRGTKQKVSEWVNSL